MPLYRAPGFFARAAVLVVLALLTVQYFLYFRGTFTQEFRDIIVPSSFLALLIFLGAYVVEGTHALATQIKAILLVLGLLFVMGLALVMTA